MLEETWSACFEMDIFGTRELENGQDFCLKVKKPKSFLAGRPLNRPLCQIGAFASARSSDVTGVEVTRACREDAQQRRGAPSSLMSVAAYSSAAPRRPAGLLLSAGIRRGLGGGSLRACQHLAGPASHWIFLKLFCGVLFVWTRKQA